MTPTDRQEGERVSKAPEKIYLQWHGDADPDDPVDVDPSEVSWCTERIFPFDVEYVRRAPRPAVPVEALEALRDGEWSCENAQDTIRYYQQGINRLIDQARGGSDD